MGACWSLVCRDIVIHSDVDVELIGLEKNGGAGEVLKVEVLQGTVLAQGKEAI